MTSVRRAGAFAAVGLLSFSVPVATQIPDPALATVVAAGPFLLVAGLALTVFGDGPLFQIFARPGDRRHGTLYGLAGFALAAAGLSILAIEFGMPVSVYVGTIVLLSLGNLGGQMIRSVRSEPAIVTAGFVAVAFLGGVGAQTVAATLLATPVNLPVIAFLAAVGALVAALLRAMLFEQDDPLVMVAVGLSLWLFASLPLRLTMTGIAVALIVTVLLGWASYALETASLAGMLTGVLLAFLTIVLGNVGWFAMLIAFFAIGGLASKFRYEEKLARGVAQEDEGARGTGNVLANSFVALVAVLAAAASGQLGLSRTLFFFAFAGSVAAALADTLSSEIGGLYDGPRLVTTLEAVEPGTDGGVTWQGTIAGVVGAGIVAGIGIGMFDVVGLAGAVTIVIAGVFGMTVDSLLGATVEDRFLENEGVNLFATLAAAVAGGGLAVALGLTSVA